MESALTQACMLALLLTGSSPAANAQKGGGFSGRQAHAGPVARCHGPWRRSVPRRRRHADDEEALQAETLVFRR
jgi:hypothetical protein